MCMMHINLDCFAADLRKCHFEFATKLTNKTKRKKKRGFTIVGNSKILQHNTRVSIGTIDDHKILLNLFTSLDLKYDRHKLLSKYNEQYERMHRHET